MADLAYSIQDVILATHQGLWFCFQTRKDGGISLARGTREPTSLEHLLSISGFKKGRGTWLAQWVEHKALNLGVVGSSSTLDVEIT